MAKLKTLQVDPWANLREQITAGNFSCNYLADTGCPGICASQAITQVLPYPVGIVWYFVRSPYTIDVMNVWTFEPLRRCGIATALIKSLVTFYPAAESIYSQAATELGGKWMTALTFVQRRDGWHYQIKAREER